ncbi:MAG: hypothetical protein PHU36_03535, partial [Syntrophomonadaceae bacterium]|nr:hypothetical protein [Syntrophomonadaceae bacterium]
GSRLVLRGNLSWSYWEDSGITPLLTEVNGSSWDGMSSAGLRPLIKTYDIRKGPTVEVIIFHGSPIRVMFRSHHAVMDGRGLMTWAEDIFRALNGLQPLGSDHTIVENDLLHFPDKKIHPAPASSFISPVGMPVGKDPERVWRRISVKGHHSKLLSRIIILCAKAARLHGEGPVRIGIPVDLRPRRPGLRSTGNLTNAIYITVDPESTIEQIAGEIQCRLKEYDDGKLNLEDILIPYVPIQIIRQILAKYEKHNFKANQYRCTGFITNLGKVNLDLFSGGGFKSTALFVLPISICSLPFFLSMIGYHDATDYVLGMPKLLASEGRLEEILSYIVTGLENMD